MSAALNGQRGGSLGTVIWLDILLVNASKVLPSVSFYLTLHIPILFWRQAPLSVIPRSLIGSTPPCFAGLVVTRD
jgi:hypothetical protein